HGLRWNKMPPLRWIADAWWILKADGQKIDEARLFEQTRRRRLTLVLSRTLRFLQQRMQAPVSAELLRRLERDKTGPRESWEFRFRTRAPGYLGALPSELCLYARLARDSGALEKIRGLPRYLAVCHNRRTYFQLARHFFFVFWNHLLRSGRRDYS